MEEAHWCDLDLVIVVCLYFMLIWNLDASNMIIFDSQVIIIIAF